MHQLHYTPGFILVVTLALCINHLHCPSKTMSGSLDAPALTLKQGQKGPSRGQQLKFASSEELFKLDPCMAMP